MKKLMIAAAIVCAAALSQAATFSWKVSSAKTPATDGSFSKTSLGSKGTFSVWLVDETTFNALAIADIYATYNGTTEGLVDSKATSSSSASITTTKDDYVKGDTVYAVSLLTYTDDNNKVWYIANKSMDTIGADGGNMIIGKMNTVYAGESTTGDLGSWSKGGINSGDSITAWQSVPEPTSGLLLLLGVAGLALRRRRA